MKGKKMSGFPAREKALNDFFAAWEPRMQTELAALEEAVGRVAAEDLYRSTRFRYTGHLRVTGSR